MQVIKKEGYRKRRENYFYNQKKKKKGIMISEFLISMGRLHIPDIILNHQFFQNKDWFFD